MSKLTCLTNYKRYDALFRLTSQILALNIPVLYLECIGLIIKSSAHYINQEMRDNIISVYGIVQDNLKIKCLNYILNDGEFQDSIVFLQILTWLSGEYCQILVSNNLKSFNEIETLFKSTIEKGLNYKNQPMIGDNPGGVANLSNLDDCISFSLTAIVKYTMRYQERKQNCLNILNIVNNSNNITLRYRCQEVKNLIQVSDINIINLLAQNISALDISVFKKNRNRIVENYKDSILIHNSQDNVHPNKTVYNNVDNMDLLDIDMDQTDNDIQTQDSYIDMDTFKENNYLTLDTEENWESNTIKNDGDSVLVKSQDDSIILQSQDDRITLKSQDDRITLKSQDDRITLKSQNDRITVKRQDDSTILNNQDFSDTPNRKNNYTMDLLDIDDFSLEINNSLEPIGEIIYQDEVLQLKLQKVGQDKVIQIFVQPIEIDITNINDLIVEV